MTLTLGEALAEFRRSNGLRSDESVTHSWRCNIGPVTLWLPNFRWRQRAIVAHDLHHVLTGYPCSLRGEFQAAAWELAAGPMPHWGARLFCTPLVLTGLFWSPRRIWAAYCAGFVSTSLHGRRIDDAFLSIPVAAARQPGPVRRARSLRFVGLLAESAAISLAPALAGVAIWWIFGN